MTVRAFLRASVLTAVLAVAACSDSVQPLDTTPDFAKSAAVNTPGGWAISEQGAANGGYAYAAGFLAPTADFSVAMRVRLLGQNPCEADLAATFNDDYQNRKGWVLILEGGDCYGPDRARHLALLVAPTFEMLESPAALSVGDWHNVEAGHRNGHWFITLDGQEYDLGNSPQPSALSPGETGYSFFASSLDGAMDDVEIRDLAAHRTVEQWRFEEGAGNTATGRNGTVLNLDNGWVWVPTNTSQASGNGGGHTIEACGTVITNPGNYVLIRDLVDCPGSGIEIRASDVTLRLKGHTIDGVGGSANGVTAGIGVPGGVQNVTIEGPGDIRSFFGGLVFEGVANSTVTGVTVHNNTFGLPINAGFNVGEFDHYSSNNVFRDVKAYYNVGHGFTLNGSTNSLFENNDMVGNGGMGILLYAGGENTVRGNHATGNYSGIWVESNASSVGHVITGNTSQGNWVVDMVDQWGDCAHDTWSGNTFGTKSPSCIQ